MRSERVTPEKLRGLADDTDRLVVARERGKGYGSVPTQKATALAVHLRDAADTIDELEKENKELSDMISGLTVR